MKEARNPMLEDFRLYFETLNGRMEHIADARVRIQEFKEQYLAFSQRLMAEL